MKMRKLLNNISIAEENVLNEPGENEEFKPNAYFLTGEYRCMKIVKVPNSVNRRKYTYFQCIN